MSTGHMTDVIQCDIDGKVDIPEDTYQLEIFSRKAKMSIVKDLCQSCFENTATVIGLKKEYMDNPQIYLKRMGFRQLVTKSGRKGSKDRVVLYAGMPISMRDVAEILLELWNNEDEIFPPPAEGSQKLMSFLTEVFKTRKITPDLLQKYQLPPE